MLILSSQMGSAASITLQFQCLKLRNRHPHRVQHPSQPGLSSLIGGAGHLLKKISTEGVVMAAD